MIKTGTTLHIRPNTVTIWRNKKGIKTGTTLQIRPNTVTIWRNKKDDKNWDYITNQTK